MTDQSLTPELSELLNDGLTALACLKAQQRAKKDAEAASRQTGIDGARDLFAADVRAGVEPALLPYLVLPAFVDDAVPGSEVEIEFAVPGCAPIRQLFRSGGQSENWKPFQYNHEPKYRVPHYELRPVYSDDEPSEQQVIEVEHSGRYDGSRHYGHDVLSLALALAMEWETERIALQARADAYNAVSITGHAAAEAKRENEQFDQKSRTRAEREALLDLLSNDPVLIALLKVVIALKQERAGYAESIEHLHDALESQGEGYESRLSEKQREADRGVRNAKDEVDIAQREADDLQTQLSRLKRQAQYA